MFKANLIIDQKYYGLRRKQLLFGFLLAMAIGPLVNFYDMPIWITAVSILLIIVIHVITLRNQKELGQTADQRIEIDQDKIELKKANGGIIETINIDNGAKIMLKKDYFMAQESMTDIKEELKGNVEKNFLVVETNGSQRRFDFVIESYYMLTQLTKVIQTWQNDNVSIEYVE